MLEKNGLYAQPIVFALRAPPIGTRHASKFCPAPTLHLTLRLSLCTLSGNTTGKCVASLRHRIATQLSATPETATRLAPNGPLLIGRASERAIDPSSNRAIDPSSNQSQHQRQHQCQRQRLTGSLLAAKTGNFIRVLSILPAASRVYVKTGVAQA